MTRLLATTKRRPSAAEQYAAPEDAPFAAALAAEPDDLTLRLVFADWLDEHGRSARAALLRAQAGDAWALPSARVRARVLRSLPVLPGVVWCDFVRGSARAEVHGLAALEQLAERPEIDAWVSLSLDSDDLRAGAVHRAAGHLGRVESLTVTGWAPLGEAMTNWLQTAPATNLTALRLRVPGLTDETAGRLAAAPGLGKLARLEMPRGRMTGTGAGALVHSDRLPALTELALPGNPLGDGFGSWVGAPVLARLTALDLSDTGCDPRAEGFERVFESLRALRTLALADNRFGDDAVERLMRALAETRLDGLDLSGNLIRDRGAALLAASRCGRALTRLDLTSNGIGADGLRALLKGPAGRPGVWTSLIDNPVCFDPPLYRWWRHARLYL